ncbi:MAG: MoaD/ThiS family protein [Planctomycetota bacterium]|nr:MoaD/ThiS family protein [Planctomycetota bacterium]
MPQIKVQLYADLRRYIDGATGIEVEIEPGRTIGQVLDQLGVPREQARILFVNHRVAKLDQSLQGAERLDVFSAIGGG